jgi:hypothetical protein
MASIQIDEVPDEWVEEAEQRDISLREYGSRMIRAGRRQFGHDYAPSETPATPNTLTLDEGTRSEIEAQLKAWIHKNLSTDQALDIEDLLDLLEDDLAELADELCDENKAKYRRSAGGYIKITDE